MGFQSLLFNFILLLMLWLAQATAKSKVAGSMSPCGYEKCGDITIPYPFGMKASCFTNPAFRVTCNNTGNGKMKPFISGINLEIIRSGFGDSQVIVNNPVTYINCPNKNENNGSLATVVNLTDTPFYFSSTDNVFGSIGCGNLATISHYNQTDSPLAGCVLPRCDDLQPASSGHDQAVAFTGCFALIPENLYTSYTPYIGDLNHGGKIIKSKQCTSVFVTDKSLTVAKDRSSFPFDDEYINTEAKYVPATLMWTSDDFDLEEPTIYQEPGTDVPQKSKGCKEKCGDVDIIYPFGTKKGCYENDWYKVTCKTGADGKQKPFIDRIHLELLNVSFLDGSFNVNHRITYTNCRSQDNNGISANLTSSPFVFSHIYNAFWSSGCGKLAKFYGNQTDLTYPTDGCLQPRCTNSETSLSSGCFMQIPSGLTSFVARLDEFYSDYKNGSERSCGSAFLIKLDDNNFNNDWTITADRHRIGNWTHVPTTLQWGTPKVGMCQLTEGSKINCSSDGQYCWAHMSPRHLCVCGVDYIGDNSFQRDVCRDANKCGNTKYKYCNILCLNDPGYYCSSSMACPDNYKYLRKEDRCEPINNNSPAKRDLAIVIGCCASIGTMFLLLGTWFLYKELKKRKDIKLKQKYFKRNGGLLLQQKLSSNNHKGSVDKIRFFTSKELEKATDYYNESRILGQGGQGTVYKGMLTDGSIVAIKKSRMVEAEKKLDETKLQQFINEVMILSQINHRNVVKLLGCCLETKVPLLVYEFIPNGTLYELIRDKSEEFPLTLEMRLRIASEVANALSYLHSAASVPIYHRDIKSSNILLDDKYRAKVSDFGTSRSIVLEQTHLTTRVLGTFGYIDPEYFRSSQFTEKSDVYSFGVVLVELLTGQKPISSRQSEEARSLVPSFLHSLKENSLFDIIDPSVMSSEGRQQEEILSVAKLAKRCLNLNGKKRPTMKQVTMELELIKASEEVNAGQLISEDEDSEMDDASGNHFDNLDLSLMISSGDCPQEEIIAVDELADTCSNLNGTIRPTMEQLAIEMEMIIRGSYRETDDIHRSANEDSDMDYRSWSTHLDNLVDPSLRIPGQQNMAIDELENRNLNCTKKKRPTKKQVVNWPHTN